jgi:hypothetical protein
MSQSAVRDRMPYADYREQLPWPGCELQVDEYCRGLGIPRWRPLPLDTLICWDVSAAPDYGPARGSAIDPVTVRVIDDGAAGRRGRWSCRPTRCAGRS